jgi:hypothetical protein
VHLNSLILLATGIPKAGHLNLQWDRRDKSFEARWISPQEELKNIDSTDDFVTNAQH